MYHEDFPPIILRFPQNFSLAAHLHALGMLFTFAKTFVIPYTYMTFKNIYILFKSTSFKNTFIKIPTNFSCLSLNSSLF